MDRWTGLLDSTVQTSNEITQMEGCTEGRKEQRRGDKKKTRGEVRKQGGAL